MKNSILTALVITTTLYACKDKNKEETKPEPTLSARQTMLMGKDWKIKSLFLEGKDVTSFFEPCMMDDVIYRFTSATAGYTDEGPSKCDQKDPQHETFTWKLDQPETRMFITNPEGTDTLNLMRITASELEMGLDQDNKFVLKN